MVIKERHNRKKTLHCTAGFLLIEATLMVGLAILAGLLATMLHGLVMRSYHSADELFRAVSCAENVLAREISGVNATVNEAPFTVVVIKKQDTSFLADIKGNSLCTVVTVDVSWHGRGRDEQHVVLSRVVSDAAEVS